MKTIQKLISFGACLLIPLTAQADVNPSSLVKVTPGNNPNCVEYYNYHGEMYCSTKALNSEPVDPQMQKNEKQLIKFDDRPWRMAWGKKDTVITTIEYVPKDDDINSWHELVTSQFIPGIQTKITPKAYADLMLENMRKAGVEFKDNFIEVSPEEVMFEFRVAQPANLVQDELQIIRKGKDGFYILHYVIKSADMGEKARKAWIGNLKGSKIK